MKLKPHGDRVLIKADPAEKRTAGGIHLLAPRADGKAAELRRGTVLAVGSGGWKGDVRIPPAVKKGDRVLFAPTFDGMEKSKKGATSLGDGELICRESDLWAVEVTDGAA